MSREDFEALNKLLGQASQVDWSMVPRGIGGAGELKLKDQKFEVVITTQLTGRILAVDGKISVIGSPATTAPHYLAGCWVVAATHLDAVGTPVSLETPLGEVHFSVPTQLVAEGLTSLSFLLVPGPIEVL